MIAKGVIIVIAQQFILSCAPEVAMGEFFVLQGTNDLPAVVYENFVISHSLPVASACPAFETEQSLLG